MRKHTIFLLGMIGCMLLSCERVEEQSMEMATLIQETEEPIYLPPDSTLTHTELHMDIPGRELWLMEDCGYLLSSGDLVIKKFARSFRGIDSYYHYVFHPDGTMQEFPDSDYLRVLIETDRNDYIVTDMSGNTAVYDQNWNLLEKSEYSLYEAAPLDGGRYYVVNDSYMTMYGGAEGGDGAGNYNHHLRALYRYTEKLTECEYTSIEPCEEGFLCKNVETGESVIIEVDDKVEKPPSTFSRVLEEELQKYYFVDTAGERLGAQLYDFASEPIRNQAIATIDGRLYLVTDNSDTNIHAWKEGATS